MLLLLTDFNSYSKYSDTNGDYRLQIFALFESIYAFHALKFNGRNSLQLVHRFKILGVSKAFGNILSMSVVWHSIRPKVH